ncbi:MAG: winged helix-turn-helix domain-containing protein [Chloroflexi bacterium]|nr:winged helix-turn-helix domain-containing protein [Chloroflexota bacterium]
MRILKEHPEVALRVLEALGNRLKALDERLEQVAFSPVKVRLAAFLLDTADPTTGAVAGLSHAEVGDTIGALRQTVTESLGAMEREGLLTVSQKLVRIVDRPGLQALVTGEAQRPGK